MNEGRWRPPGIRLLDAPRHVESDLQPHPDLSPELRQVSLWKIIGKRINEVVTVVKRSGLKETDE